MRISIGEQVERAARLFKTRPEHRSAEEQGDDNDDAFLFGGIQFAERKDVHEKCHSNADNNVGRKTGDFNRVKRNGTAEPQANETPPR